MSLLRLLTLPTILGADAVTRAEAWRVVDALAISARDDHSHKLWTDDYLAAFAQTGGFHLVTLDQRLAGRYPSIDVITLGV